MKRARWILTIPALVTLIVPAVMDLNESHQLNEAWPPHARYHGAILLSANVISGLISLWMLWGAKGGDAASRLRTAALLPAVIWGSFFPALLAPGVSTFPDGAVRPEALPFAPNVIIGGLMVVLCIVGARMASRAPDASPALSGKTP
jgi:hypothetical protein